MYFKQNSHAKSFVGFVPRFETCFGGLFGTNCAVGGFSGASVGNVVVPTASPVPVRYAAPVHSSSASAAADAFGDSFFSRVSPPELKSVSAFQKLSGNGE